MRILIFSTQYPPATGGVQNMIYHLSTQFQQQGHSVSVVTVDMPEAAAFDDQQGFSIQRIPVGMGRGSHKAYHKKLLSGWLLAHTLRQEIQRFRPDVILCSYWHPEAYLVSLLRYMGVNVPYFIITHGKEVFRPTGLPQSVLYSMAFKRAAAIFAVSGATATSLRAAQITPLPIEVIANGVDSSVILPQPATDQSDSRRRILTVCRLIPGKGCDTVIRALPLLVTQFPDLLYTIVGHGQDRERLQTLAAELGVEAHVEFRGRVSDEERNRLYQEACVFVMPSKVEGFGIVFLEAMGAGTPVIGADAGGIPDAIEHNVTGLLVPPEAPEKLAEAIRTLLDDATLRTRLTQQAQSRLTERFLWPSIAARYLHHIEACLAG